ncbi:hypothetical protein [Pseudorhodoferax sp. Leaf265]|uniref:hypothetical protein n=1 Tax=Pseudorhodoferax sp. Leaf265 TaxID=1736315 RepID=UPI0012E8A186|nr:hypothetical protein [Pseudorhodoferax sp. Leaf265]
MLRTLLQQIEFQRPVSYGFLRWPALIGRQDRNHPSYRQFVATLGMSPEHFIDLSYGVYAAVLSDDGKVPGGWFDTLKPSYGASVDAFWGLFVRDLFSLRQQLRGEAAGRLTLKQELASFPHLKRYPLFRGAGGAVRCWHPLVFARGLEEAAHLRLSELQDQYTRPFSRLFEQYVIELAKTMLPDALSDAEYLAAVGGGENSNVEAAAVLGDCNVFVEAKMALFSDELLLTDSEWQVYTKTKPLRKAIDQAWNVGRAVRTPSTSLREFSSADQDFLLVVTSRELHVGGGEKLRSLYRQGRLEHPDAEAQRNLPFHNVFVVSIESFERLTIAVAAGKVHLATVLKDAARRCQDPSTARPFFEDYFSQQVSDWGMSPLLLHASDGSEARLSHALGAD